MFHQAQNNSILARSISNYNIIYFYYTILLSALLIIYGKIEI